MELFDTHAHLNDEQYSGIIESVIERAENSFVTRTLVVGTTLKDSERALELAHQFPGLYAAVGIQPNYVHEAAEDAFDQIMELACDPRVVAIGETGLDRYWDNAPFDLQQEYFDQHIRLAYELDKPFVVHMRDCGEDILNSLNAFRAQKPLKGIMHSFTGDETLAQACMDFGLHISFAGMVTFKKSEELRQVAASIPMDRLLVETDSPYLTPHPKRGHRPNEPGMVIHTAECLAQLKDISLEEFAAQTTLNANRLFGLAG